MNKENLINLKNRLESVKIQLQKGIENKSIPPELLKELENIKNSIGNIK